MLDAFIWHTGATLALLVVGYLVWRFTGED